MRASLPRVPHPHLPAQTIPGSFPVTCATGLVSPRPCPVTLPLAPREMLSSAKATTSSQPFRGPWITEVSARAGGAREPRHSHGPCRRVCPRGQPFLLEPHAGPGGGLGATALRRTWARRPEVLASYDCLHSVPSRAAPAHQPRTWRLPGTPPQPGGGSPRPPAHSPAGVCQLHCLGPADRCQRLPPRAQERDRRETAGAAQRRCSWHLPGQLRFQTLHLQMLSRFLGSSE